MWDIERKKGWTFEGKHMNMINKVLLWDEYSAFSCSIDRSIRYFDRRDWGNANDNFTEDSDTLNGYKYSKYFMGHKKSVTQLRRLNNSHNRIVSASEDGTIKIWDLYTNLYCDSYSNSKHKFKDNTEIIEPLQSIGADDAAGIRHLEMNQNYLVSYSNEANELVVRDWEKPNQPLLTLTNLGHVLGLTEVHRGQYSGAGFEIANMVLCKEDQHLLITSESKRMRIWDLRQPL